MDFKTLRKWLTKNGYEVTGRVRGSANGGSGGHLQLWSPDGEKVAQWPSSPQQEGPAVKNYVARLRRLGVDVPRKGEKW